MTINRAFRLKLKNGGEFIYFPNVGNNSAVEMINYLISRNEFIGNDEFAIDPKDVSEIELWYKYDTYITVDKNIVNFEEWYDEKYQETRP